MKHQIKLACAPTMDACMSNYSKTLIIYVTTIIRLNRAYPLSFALALGQHFIIIHKLLEKIKMFPYVYLR